MKFAIPCCPTCGEQASGTLETVPGVALIQPDEKHPGHFDYAGETKMFWDSQETVTDVMGAATLICDHGHEWQSFVSYDDADAEESPVETFLKKDC